jgi:tetratricopeptide (TPR) repeat protein
MKEGKTVRRAILSPFEDNQSRKRPHMKTVAWMGIALALPMLSWGQSPGISLYKEGKYAEAARVLAAEVEKAPEDIAKLTYLGLARVYAGDTSGALEALNKAVAKDDEYADAHYGLGLCDIKLKKFDQAISELDRAVRLDPEHAYAHYYLGMTYNQTGKKDLAVLHYRRFLELAPNAPEAPSVRAFLSKT